jgi:hypothetical protein
MSDDRECVAYILQETKGAPISLAVLDKERQAFHVFPLSILGASRIASECAAAVHEHLGGLNMKFPLQEIATQLSVAQRGQGDDATPDA